MNSSCQKCKAIEPQNWDSRIDGIWVCNCKTKNKITLDEFFKMINKKENKND